MGKRAEFRAWRQGFKSWTQLLPSQSFTAKWFIIPGLRFSICKMYGREIFISKFIISSKSSRLLALLCAHAEKSSCSLFILVTLNVYPKPKEHLSPEQNICSRGFLAFLPSPPSPPRDGAACPVLVPITQTRTPASLGYSKYFSV